jgi:hypothetical protein
LGCAELLLHFWFILRQIEPGTEVKWRTATAVYDGSDATSVGRINKNNSTISNYFKTITSTTIQNARGKKAEQGGNKSYVTVYKIFSPPE